MYVNMYRIIKSTRKNRSLTNGGCNIIDHRFSCDFLSFVRMLHWNEITTLSSRFTRSRLNIENNRNDQKLKFYSTNTDTAKWREKYPNRQVVNTSNNKISKRLRPNFH